MATMTTNPIARDGLTRTALSALDALRARIVARRIYRTTVSELSRLSVRELDDLGISRGDIARIAREAAGL